MSITITLGIDTIITHCDIGNTRLIIDFNGDYAVSIHDVIIDPEAQWLIKGFFDFNKMGS